MNVKVFLVTGDSWEFNSIEKIKTGLSKVKLIDKVGNVVGKFDKGKVVNIILEVE